MMPTKEGQDFGNGVVSIAAENGIAMNDVAKDFETFQFSEMPQDPSGPPQLDFNELDTMFIADDFAERIVGDFLKNSQSPEYKSMIEQRGKASKVIQDYFNVQDKNILPPPETPYVTGDISIEQAKQREQRGYSTRELAAGLSVEDLHYAKG
ncbi:MAG: hypothetical protein WC476_13410, partial [Phycisphaerae bacterium]